MKATKELNQECVLYLTKVYVLQRQVLGDLRMEFAGGTIESTYVRVYMLNVNQEGEE